MSKNPTIDIGKLINIDFGDLTQSEWVNKAEVESLKHEQENCPVYHHFYPGIYIREVNMSAGVFAIGHKQKHDHLNVFLKGRLSMVEDDGTLKELKAPMIFMGKPGRKAGFIHEDVVWLNIYPTDETDIEMLEETYLDKSEGWNENIRKPCRSVKDVMDFCEFLEENGLDAEQVKEESERTEDLIDFPPGVYQVAVFKSNIHGKGLYATAPFKTGDFICPGRINGKRTPAGRYINHGKIPNAVPVKNTDGDINFFCTMDISGCRGGLNGDEITIDYRESFKLREV